MSKPTSRQLRFLKGLADRTGQTFTYPDTSAEASAEIDRLRGGKPQSRGERRYERKLIADQIAAGANNTAVNEDETSGYGSEASWRHNHQPEPQIISSSPTPTRKTSRAGERVELARYTVRRGGDRILYGQRVDGRVRVTDRPAGAVDEQHRAHLVENDLETKTELDALVTDYLLRAEQLQVVPAAAIPFDLTFAEPASQ